MHMRHATYLKRERCWEGLVRRVSLATCIRRTASVYHLHCGVAGLLNYWKCI